VTADVPSVLQKIVAHKRGEVAARKAARPTVDLRAAPPVRDFTAALQPAGRVGVIAEVKQASPSRGVMRPDFDPVALASTYARHGAACLSVLTDEEFFRGHDRYLTAIRAAVDLPVLRKEFLIDPWQIDESRALGADAVLLIVAILTPSELREYHARATELGMSVLVETHTAPELEVALASGARLLGINNRNLHTFETSLDTTDRLAALARAAGGDRLLVSESGLYTAADVARVAACGARAVLVGEALVREGDPATKVAELASVALP
jgi:indole-3-glycerol phosphate synthase